MLQISYLATLQAIYYVALPFCIVLVIAFLISLALKFLGTKEYRAAVNFNLSFRIALAFATYAFTLGLFVGMSGNALTTTIAGTVVTLGTTYLAILYGKDAVPDSQNVILPALISFFLVIPFAIEYAIQMPIVGSELAVPAPTSK